MLQGKKEEEEEEETYITSHCLILLHHLLILLVDIEHLPNSLGSGLSLHKKGQPTHTQPKGGKDGEGRRGKEREREERGAVTHTFWWLAKAW